MERKRRGNINNASQWSLSIFLLSGILITIYFLHRIKRLEEKYQLRCLWKVQVTIFCFFKLSYIFNIFYSEYKLWSKRENDKCYIFFKVWSSVESVEYFLSLQHMIWGIFVKHEIDQVASLYAALLWLLVVPFCIQLDLLNLPCWGSFDGNVRGNPQQMVALLFLLVNNPSFLAGPQGHQPPHAAPFLDCSSSFWMCSLRMWCSLSLESFSPTRPHSVCFCSGHFSKNRLWGPKCLGPECSSLLILTTTLEIALH